MGYDMTIEKISDDTGYFRLNVWGMARYGGAMAQLGMLANSGDHPAWPEAPEDFDWDACYEARLTEPSHIEYEATRQHVLSWHGPDAKGIEEHKFCSNDDWLVTPEEIHAALAAYDAQPEHMRIVALANAGVTERGYWDKWIAYLRRAEQNGGLRVA